MPDNPTVDLSGFEADKKARQNHAVKAILAAPTMYRVDFSRFPNDIEASQSFLDVMEHLIHLGQAIPSGESAFIVYVRSGLNLVGIQDALADAIGRIPDVTAYPHFHSVIALQNQQDLQPHVKQWMLQYHLVG